jgi:hypothetical protein
MADPDFLRHVERDLTDKGLLIEAGWTGFRVACGLHDAPKAQLEQMRNAFFAGSQHLFASVLTLLEEGEEPTDNDLRRMDLIHDELDRFIREFAARYGLPEPPPRKAH